MIIHIDELTKLLKGSGLPQQGVPPDEILTVKFGADTSPTGDGAQWDRNDCGSVLLDFDEAQRVVSIELTNVPLDHKWRTGPLGRVIDPTR